MARIPATLHILTFTRGCSQLSPTDAEATRKLVDVRMHRMVIGATCQRYSILMSLMPINFLKPKHPDNKPPIDKILLVCLALKNLYVSVVPLQ